MVRISNVLIGLIRAIRLVASMASEDEPRPSQRNAAR
jgi:hypothetical protein